MKKFTFPLKDVRTDKVFNFALGESFICNTIDDEAITFTMEKIEFEYSDEQETSLRADAEEMLRFLVGSVDDMELPDLLTRALLAEFEVCADPDWDESHGSYGA